MDDKETETINMPDGQGAARAKATASAEATAEIGDEIAKNLRALYARQVAEPLPEKFTNLLAKLAKSETGK